VVSLRRNVGHQTALAAGLAAAHGAYVVTIDADLQDPPEVIGDMLAAARGGDVDVVYGVRSDRSTDTRFKRKSARAYYWTMRRLVGPWVSDNAGDFRLMSRAVVDVLTALPEQRPVYRLVVPSLGFRSAEVRYVRAERVAGETKYPLGKMIKMTLDSVTSFSAAPLRIATWLGLLSFLVCLGLMISGLVAWSMGGTVPGWTSLYIAVLLLGGVQLICLGLLGEYIGRIYAATQNRPQFLVAFDSGAEQTGAEQTGAQQTGAEQAGAEQTGAEPAEGELPPVAPANLVAQS
jgi:dolichol-phosphate mannosyltransferase